MCPLQCFWFPLKYPDLRHLQNWTCCACLMKPVVWYPIGTTLDKIFFVIISKLVCYFISISFPVRVWWLFITHWCIWRDWIIYLPSVLCFESCGVTTFLPGLVVGGYPLMLLILQEKKSRIYIWFGATKTMTHDSTALEVKEIGL